MPKFQCKCGYTLDLIKIPSDFEFSLIPEKSIEEAGDYVEKGSSRDELFKILDSYSTTVYRCPKCDSLHIEHEKGSNSFKQYSAV